MHLGISKLLNYSKPPNHRTKTLLPNGFVASQAKIWRDYLAKRLDKNPELLIKSADLGNIIVQIQQHGFNDEEILNLLRNVYCDDADKAVKLLKAHLDESGEEMRMMATVICHRCNVLGHPVKVIIIIITISTVYYIKCPT